MTSGVRPIQVRMPSTVGGWISPPSSRSITVGSYRVSRSSHQICLQGREQKW